MLKLKAMNDTAKTIEEVNLTPELTAAKAETTDQHREEKSHPSTGRARREFRPVPALVSVQTIVRSLVGAGSKRSYTGLVASVSTS